MTDIQLGIKLKTMRLQCGFTQEELADRCELTKGYISQLENDLTSPSIATLIDILAALGSDLRAFFNEEREEQVVFREEDFFTKTGDGQSVVWLVPNSQKNEMEPILQEIGPRVSLTEDMPHEGEEFGYVLEGDAALYLGKKKHVLKKGDSFYFTANKTHFLANESDAPVKLLWVSSPPTF